VQVNVRPTSIYLSTVCMWVCALWFLFFLWMWSESEEDVDIFFLTTCSAFLSRPLTKCARYRNAMIQGRRSCQPKGGSGMQAIVVITPKGVWTPIFITNHQPVLKRVVKILMSFGIETLSILLMEVEPPSPLFLADFGADWGLRMPTTDYRLPTATRHKYYINPNAKPCQEPGK